LATAHPIFGSALSVLNSARVTTSQPISNGVGCFMVTQKTTETALVSQNDEIEYSVEMTDTFGGEANYAWVKRRSFRASRALSDLALVRRAKMLMGITGISCRRLDMGDAIALYPCGSCTVVFISAIY
jgi:hypothetical protein